MKKSLLLATCVALVLILELGATRVAAQQPAAPRPPIAIIDTNTIYQRHVRYQNLIADVKRDMLALQQQAEIERKSLGDMVARLKDFKKGTPDYKATEDEITRRQADLQVKFASQEKSILERRAKVLYDVHREMAHYVKDYADRFGILLVIRFSGDKVENTNDPDEITRELNKLVMYYQPAIDITDVILNACNQNAGPTPTPPTPTNLGPNPSVNGGGGPLSLPRTR